MSVSHWEPIVSKIRQKLSLWKGTLLSRFGRLVLIKSVLQSIPIFYLSVFPMPKTTKNKIQSIMTHFVWKGKESRGICKVAWMRICENKIQRGLDLAPLEVVNQSLLMKWV